MLGNSSGNGRSHASQSPAELHLIEAFRLVGEALADAIGELRHVADRPVATTAAPRAEAIDRLVGVARAAELLAVSERHVRSLLTSGALPRVKVGERVLIDMADLDKFIAERKTSANGDANHDAADKEGRQRP